MVPFLTYFLRWRYVKIRSRATGQVVAGSIWGRMMVARTMLKLYCDLSESLWGLCVGSQVPSVVDLKADGIC